MTFRIGRAAFMAFLAAVLLAPMAPVDTLAKQRPAKSANSGRGGDHGWNPGPRAERDREFGRDTGKGDFADTCDVVLAGSCAGQVIVHFQAGYGPADVKVIADANGAMDIDWLYPRGLVLYRTSGNAAELANQLAASPVVDWVERNTVDQQPIGSPRIFTPRAYTSPAAVADDALNSSTALAAVKGREAAACFNGAGVVVAVIDTGFSADGNELFQGGVTQGFNAFTRTADVQEGVDGSVKDAAGHGTHIAGIIRQIAPTSTIMPIKALDADGQGQAFYLAVAMDYAIATGADVINLSLGARQPSKAVDMMIGIADQQGIVVVAAGGNDGNDTRSYPAAADGGTLMGVAATGLTDSATGLVNYQMLASYTSRYRELDLAAPGTDVISAFPVGLAGIDTGWAIWSGSSMATAWVSGAAADVIAKNQTIDGDAVVQQLKRTATTLSGDTGNTDGKGGMQRRTMLDAGKAVCGAGR
ncbi:MAG: S8 family peptidase [Chloroflexota bacterium]